MPKRLPAVLTLLALAVLPLCAADDAENKALGPASVANAADESQVPPLEEGFNDEPEKSVNLALTPEEAHDKYLEDSRPVWYKRLPYGLGRGLLNIATSPAEIARGYSLAFGEDEWYLMPLTGLAAGLGGFLSRLGAGVADIATGGLMGDRTLSEGFPSYVWQGQWSYGSRSEKDEAERRLAAEDARLNVKSEIMSENGAEGGAQSMSGSGQGSRIPSPTERTKADPQSPSRRLGTAAEASRDLPGQNGTESARKNVRRENPVIRRYR